MKEPFCPHHCTLNLLVNLPIKAEYIALGTISKSWRNTSLGIWEISEASMASRQASLPSSCGILVYRLETSIVTSIALLGMGVFCRSEIR